MTIAVGFGIADAFGCARSLPQSTIRFRVPDSVFELEAQENPRLATLKEKFFRTVRREKREHKLLDFLQYSDHYAVTGNCACFMRGGVLHISANHAVSATVGIENRVNHPFSSRSHTSWLHRGYWGFVKTGAAMDTWCNGIALLLALVLNLLLVFSFS